MNRPDLKVGDIVRLSHRGAKLYRSMRNLVMTVVAIPSGSQDGKMHVQVVVADGLSTHKLNKCSFQRRMLWKTGYNCYDAGKSFTIKKQNKANVGAINLQSYILTPKFVGAMPKVSNADLDALIKAFSSPAKQKDEIECPICKRKADKGLKCWHCGTQL